MKLPFLALKVALGKISFLGVEKHVTILILVKIFWAHSSSIEKGVRFAEKVDGPPIIYCNFHKLL